MSTIFDEQSQVAAVRYIVNDVDSAIQFYMEVLGFHLNQHIKSAFLVQSVTRMHGNVFAK
jgi:hypothetical protein